MDHGQQTGVEFAGSLDRTPFPELLMQLLVGQSEGTVQIDAHGERDSLLIRGGRVSGARFAHTAPTVSRGLVPLCSLEEGEFTLLPGDEVSGYPDAIAGVVDPIPFLSRALRMHVPRGAVVSVRRSYEQLAMAVQAEVDVRRYGLLDRELQVVELLRARTMTAPELEVRSTMPVESLHRLLYLFQVTGLVAPTAQPSRSRSQVRPRTVPPAASSKPASGPSSALDSLRHGRRVSTRVPAAPRTPTLDAMSPRALVRLIDGLCRRHEFDEAQAVADRMVENDRKSADAYAMRAWVVFQRDPGHAIEHPELMEALDRALHLDQGHPRALYVKGCALREGGRSDEAVSYFMLVRDTDPRILGREDVIRVAAERELRIAAIKRRHR